MMFFQIKMRLHGEATARIAVQSIRWLVKCHARGRWPFCRAGSAVGQLAEGLLKLDSAVGILLYKEVELHDGLQVSGL